MSNNTGMPLPHLRAWRLRAYLTQRQLAHKAGLSRAAIIDIENAKYCGAQLRSIHMLASALNVTLQQLVEEEPK